MRVERQPFYESERVVRAVQEQVEKAGAAGERVDYLTFVPDGAPTLDANLGREMALLKPLGIPIAVISNGSLAWREDVREDLMREEAVGELLARAQADWSTVRRLVALDQLVEAEYGGQRFYLRKLGR